MSTLAMPSQIRPKDEKPDSDYGQLHPSRTVRALYMTVGFIAMGLGIVGAFLPLLPTTVFILIAAFCFARSSRRLHSALMENKHFGPVIRNWQENKCISRQNKVWAITLVILSFAVTTTVFVEALYLRAGLVLTAVLLVAYLYSLPTCPEDYGTGSSPSRRKS